MFAANVPFGSFVLPVQYVISVVLEQAVFGGVNDVP